MSLACLPDIRLCFLHVCLPEDLELALACGYPSFLIRFISILDRMGHPWICREPAGSCSSTHATHSSRGLAWPSQLLSCSSFPLTAEDPGSSTIVLKRTVWNYVSILVVDPGWSFNFVASESVRLLDSHLVRRLCGNCSLRLLPCYESTPPTLCACLLCLCSASSFTDFDAYFPGSYGMLG